MMPRLPLLVLCTIAIFAVGIHATSIRKSIGGRTGNVVTKTASVEPDIMYRCVAGMTATLSLARPGPQRSFHWHESPINFHGAIAGACSGTAG